MTSAQVVDQIAADPRFQVGGKFSLDAYKAALDGARVPEPAYEESVRRQILAERFVDPIARGSIVAGPTRVAFVTLLEQAREVAVATIDAEPFARDVKVDAAAVKAFYDSQRGAVQDARGSQLRIRDPDAGRAVGRRDGHAGRGEGAVRGASRSSTRRRSSGRPRTSSSR